jgi:glycerol uptake facilitator-like aquaporin
MLLDKLKMEFFGTFAIVYFVGMLHVQYTINTIDVFGLAAGTFFIYSLFIWAGRSISGSHYNPVISMALALTRHSKPQNALIYSMFHFFAAFFAISVIRISITSDIISLLQGATMLGFPKQDLALWRQMLFELIGTFFYVLTYYLLFIEKNAPKDIYGAGIAGAAFVNVLFAFSKSGCGMNPVRMFSYCAITNEWKMLWPYLAGPIIGGVLGALLGNLLLSEKAETSRAKKKEEKKRLIQLRKNRAEKAV